MQIPNITTLTAQQKEDLVTFICYKNQKNNLLNLRKVVGDDGLLALLNKFAGTYVKFPTISGVVELANKQYMVHLYDELKTAANSGDPRKWQEAEQKFTKFADIKFGLDYPTARHQVKKIKVELEQAKQWIAGINSWEQRNSP